MRRSARYTAFILASLSAVLLYLANEPAGFGPLGWIALVPLFVAVYREPRRRWAFAYGLWFGLLYFGPLLSWIFLFGWMAWSGLVITMSLYIAAAAVVAHIGRRLPLAPVLAAGGWVAFELLRDRWPFGGFPWGAVGTTQAGVPGVRWLAGTVGAYGLSFLAAFAAAVVADRVVNRQLPWGSLALVTGVVLLFAGVDTFGFSPPEGRSLRIAGVQGNVPRPYRANQNEIVFENHIELTRRVVPGTGADVVVWPESALFDGGGSEVERTEALASELGVPMLVGRYEAVPADQAFLNLVDHVTPTDGVVGAYQKMHPVPFGEFVPLSFLRGVVDTLDQIPYDMAPGPGPVVFDIDGVRVAAPICFESVFPRDVRSFARSGAEVYAFVTNDSSYERTPAASQHLMHTRMRVLEMRQWGVQVAISGISAVLHPDGTVSGATELFTPDVVIADVQARPASSLYARVGDLFAWGWTAGTALALVLWASVMVSGRRRPGRHAEPADEPAPSVA